MTKWRREADERTEAEREAREERARIERRARREAVRVARSVDEARLEEALQFERDITNETVGTLIGEMINDLRSEIEKKLQVSLRIAILEQSGLCPRVRGTWQATETYSALDVVACDGSTFICKRTGAGQCPGEDWQVLACRGERGKPGPVGPRGETGPVGARGETGMNLNGWLVNGYRITPVLGGGSPGPTLDLRPLFQRFLDEQANAATTKVARAAEHRHVHSQPPLVALVHGSPPPAAEEGPVG